MTVAASVSRSSVCKPALCADCFDAMAESVLAALQVSELHGCLVAREEGDAAVCAFLFSEVRPFFPVFLF